MSTLLCQSKQKFCRLNMPFIVTFNSKFKKAPEVYIYFYIHIIILYQLVELPISQKIAMCKLKLLAQGKLSIPLLCPHSYYPAFIILLRSREQSNGAPCSIMYNHKLYSVSLKILYIFNVLQICNSFVVQYFLTKLKRSGIL